MIFIFRGSCSIFTIPSLAMQMIYGHFGRIIAGLLKVSSEGEVVHYGYPSEYENNLDYNISIHFAHDQFIVLRFIEFGLQNDICQGESCSSSNISCRSVSLKMSILIIRDNLMFIYSSN